MLGVLIALFGVAIIVAVVLIVLAVVGLVAWWVALILPAMLALCAIALWASARAIERMFRRWR